MGSMQAILYYPIFLTVMLVAVIVHFYRIYPMDTDTLLDRRKPTVFIAILVVAIVLFLGLRPVSGRAFGDTATYAAVYMLMADDMLIPDFSTGDWLFSYIMYSSSKVMSIQYFFLIIEILYIVPVYIACRRLSPENSTTLMIFFLTAFSFFSYGTNGIRNGAAASIFILALSFLKGDRPVDKILFVLIALLAYNLHHSMALPIMAVVAAYFIRNPKLMFYFWGASIVVSLTIGGSISDIFSGLGFDDRLNNYISGETVDDLVVKDVFRWDFLLYSAMPVVLGWYVIFRRRIYTRTYSILLGTYIYANAFWVMVIRAAFSNRFAYLSWCIYPIVLAYPMLVMPVWKDKPGLKLGIIMVGHMAFTIFMWYWKGQY
ncbi:MAG: EpsG family protein [Bacteroidales bacterium]|nr:EpsG family protein [Bacteroidales bacterium]